MKTILCTASILILSIFGTSAAEERIFTMSLNTIPIEFNPLYTETSIDGQISTAIYEGLVSLDPQSLEPIPAVAESWEILEDGLLYRFHINPQARYSNGDPIRSSDFRNAWLKLLKLDDAFSFASLLDPIVNANEYREGELTDSEMVGIQAVNNNVLEIQLEYPSTYFLSILAHQSFVAIHPQNLKIRDWATLENHYDSGPYTVSTIRENSFEFERNEFYWDKENLYYDKIIVVFNDDESDVTQKFNRGEIQWVASNFDSSILQIRDAVHIFQIFGTSYYFFSAKDQAFQNENLRRALFHLLPLNEIRSSDNYFFPSSKLIPQIPQYPNFDAIEEEDKNLALELLSEAGFPNGEGLPPITIVLPDYPDFHRVSQIMKTTWEENLNVSVERKFVEYSHYEEILSEEGFTIASLTWIGDFADPISFLQLWQSNSTLNFAQFSDPVFDELLQKTNGLSGEERLINLSAAEEYLLNTGIVLPTQHSAEIHLIDLDLVGGWYPNLLDIHPFKNLYKKPQKAPAGVTMRKLF